jgi:hypothetical protein
MMQPTKKEEKEKDEFHSYQYWSSTMMQEQDLENMLTEFE